MIVIDPQYFSIIAHNTSDICLRILSTNADEFNSLTLVIHFICRLYAFSIIFKLSIVSCWIYLWYTTD